MSWTIEIPDDIKRVVGYNDNLDEWFAEKLDHCPTCEGSGEVGNPTIKGGRSSHNAPPAQCPTCGGSGTIPDIDLSCPTCHGSGKYNVGGPVVDMWMKCPTCHGRKP